MSVCTIRCIVIHMPVEEAARPRLRPSDMLPWADPYIANLIAKCQQEVAAERRQKMIDSLRFLPRTKEAARGSVESRRIIDPVRKPR